MFRQFYPRTDYKSTYDIDFGRYYRKGFRGVLFDVDNTLVEHDEPATQRAIDLFQNLHKMGFQTYLISNNKDYRVKPFADAVGTRFIYMAHKPSPKGYEKAMRRMKIKPENTLFVGDQVFTDIWGANRAGIYSILVKQIARHEEIQIVLKRYLERIVLHGYWKKKRQRKSKQNIE